jgi:hypothetical protein
MLTSDADYIELLGSPTAQPYKTYYIYPPTTPDFPYVVFSLRPGSVQDEIGKEIISKRVDLKINVWSQDDTYEDIANRIIYLLHQKGNGNGFRIVYDSDNSELHDPQMNAYGLAMSFNVFLRKGII